MSVFKEFMTQRRFKNQGCLGIGKSAVRRCTRRGAFLRGGFGVTMGAAARSIEVHELEADVTQGFPVENGGLKWS